MTKLKSMPTTISISAKCSDMFSSTFLQDGTPVADYNGYVPAFFPEEHYGDYVQLDIDLATGQILNWKKPSLKAINDSMKED